MQVTASCCGLRKCKEALGLTLAFRAWVYIDLPFQAESWTRRLYSSLEQQKLGDHDSFKEAHSYKEQEHQTHTHTHTQDLASSLLKMLMPDIHHVRAVYVL